MNQKSCNCGGVFRPHKAICKYCYERIGKGAYHASKNASARAIMQKFVDKVGRGMARSTETYAEMTSWLEDE